MTSLEMVEDTTVTTMYVKLLGAHHTAFRPGLIVRCATLSEGRVRRSSVLNPNVSHSMTSERCGWWKSS